MPSLDAILSVFGAFCAFCQALSLVVPKGSGVGKFLARVADLKGHNS